MATLTTRGFSNVLDESLQSPPAEYNKFRSSQKIKSPRMDLPCLDTLDQDLISRGSLMSRRGFCLDPILPSSGMGLSGSSTKGTQEPVITRPRAKQISSDMIRRLQFSIGQAEDADAPEELVCPLKAKSTQQTTTEGV